ncbi:MAG TPA: hypothetical protein VGW78_04145, partial [Candidatus Babeliales bacterium]|nr:hypothetical protein [Candidatus Babeliales bacterium]
YAQEAAKTYQETAPKQPSWYARNIQPYIESWKQRTAPALEQYQPHTGEEGSEVGQTWKQRTTPILETYQPYTAEGYEVAKQRTAPALEQYQPYEIEEKYEVTPKSTELSVEEYLASHPIRENQPILNELEKYYKNIEEYLATYPSILVRDKYEEILKKHKKSPVKTILLNNLAAETANEEKNSIAVWDDLAKRKVKRLPAQLSKDLTERYDQLKKEHSNLDIQVDKGARRYADAQKIKKEQLRAFSYLIDNILIKHRE